MSYRGVKLSKSIQCYDDAVAALEERGHRAGRVRKVDVVKPGGEEASLGHPRARNTGVRMLDDEAIAFRLYATDVVIWRKDNSFEVENWGSATTTAFAHELMPAGVGLRYSERAGHKLFTFVTEPVERGRWWRRHHVCSGDYAIFREQDKVWLPDEDTLNTMKFPKLNRAGAAKARKKYSLTDFDNWLSMAPRHTRIEHEGWDLETCMRALERRDFKAAAQSMPVLDLNEPRYGGFGIRDRVRDLGIVTKSWRDAVTTGCIQKLKVAVWEAEGLFEVEEFVTMRASDYERRMPRVRELNKYGRAGDWGPK